MPGAPSQSALGAHTREPCAGELLDFTEKPTGNDLEKMLHASGSATPELPFEASMGIYVFNKAVLEELLADPREAQAKPDNHFGHHILPRALREDYRVMNYHFDKYWRVGCPACTAGSVCVLCAARLHCLSAP